MNHYTLLKVIYTNFAFHFYCFSKGKSLKRRKGKCERSERRGAIDKSYVIMPWLHFFVNRVMLIAGCRAGSASWREWEKNSFPVWRLNNFRGFRFLPSLIRPLDSHQTREEGKTISISWMLFNCFFQKRFISLNQWGRSPRRWRNDEGYVLLRNRQIFRKTRRIYYANRISLSVWQFDLSRQKRLRWRQKSLNLKWQREIVT